MATKQKRQFLKPEYEEEKNLLVDFITNYTDVSIIDIDASHGRKKYMIALQRVINRQSKRIDILIEDLEDYFNDKPAFTEKIASNTLSYQRLFYEVTDNIKLPITEIVEEEDDDFDEEVNRQREQAVGDLYDGAKRLPADLTRRYQLFIIRGGHTKSEILSVRGIKAGQIGSLVTIRGVVVRATEVRPQILVACYACDACGYENYQTVNGKTFNPLLDCASDKCRDNKVRGRLIFNHGSSKFVPQQDIKIQELKDQLPKGSIPRTFTVIVKGETNVRQCSPGDLVDIQGVYLPNEKEGYFAAKSSLFTSYLEAFVITRLKKKYSEYDTTGEAAMNIYQELERPDFKFEEFYLKLADSIAPEIYGMHDVKKALLLMMVGGVTKEMEDGLKIRGDINVALIGDPGVAKSQLLRYISNVCPRGVYTTGKGSSSVGLTAAVMRDQITGEMTLEGGALVMADKGVCCIDEFDKMNESDRTAIHEVMEQQTVSIAKAGITTTLNARTSILAAANPLYGRYNRKFTPHKNINLPAALLSRFDLIFILLDEVKEDDDRKLASHIGYVHQHLKSRNQKGDVFTEQEMTTFISLAIQKEPIITESVHEFIADQYVSKRSQTYDIIKQGYSYTTPRTLLGIIRLSQAIAKLKLANAVTHADVEEAIRLMEVSQETVRDAMTENPMERKRDATTELFELLRTILKKNNNRPVDVDSFTRQAQAKSFTRDRVATFIKLYQSINQVTTYTHDGVEKIDIV